MDKKELTPRRRIFVLEYLIHRNATKAAKLAGYSEKTARSAGARLLTNVDIIKAIENGLREQIEKADISANNVIQSLKAIAFAESYDGNFSGKLRALELLGKSMGLFQDKPKPTLNDLSASVLLGPSHISSRKY